MQDIYVQSLGYCYGPSTNVNADEVNQVLTTNLWLEMKHKSFSTFKIIKIDMEYLQQWNDYKLTWDPEKWNNIRNADGEPHITIMSDALVYYTGAVVWKPPSIYKSFCPKPRMGLD
ncbi:unnamed protein product [Gongylonema pulchrum]|uniref:Neur_chan_LBD domain-containing protein n=1 Tax=Gongylonema pulchrum TaxID=637853 RepID=A0A183DVP7_9BILA|nr:unnamed protein product [Gongylonema pulchrum]